RIKNKESFDFYREGATREIVNYMEQVDDERRNIARAFGVEVQSLREWLCERYGLQEKNLYDALHNNPFYGGLLAPKSFDMRYLTEDIPTGLVPFSELGKVVGVSTNQIDRLIEIASEELRIDFRNQGRNLSRLGLNSETIYEDLRSISELETIKDYRLVLGET
ncbi:MAG: NAD/NADP octopine/nopaline dehydrogenase family protein, partial [Candidatus Heimdallarchaeota archaeon]|nr:NAD/NADP octopine/nopaline dehydrogenase family protein [Candidatus Heimdallarchaeota archaeon]MCK4954046.1 NAD/NADP octopine/nopaline dehydrogenase family protein [Candidatus Heimdallarchaeota archaeon]